MSKAIVMQGLPGSGKTSWIRESHPDGMVCSSDHYFEDTKTGEYKFNPEKLGEAHSACLRSFLHFITCCMGDQGDEVVIVDNTNLSLWEMSQYVMSAAAMGYSVEVVRVVADPEECAQRNVHGVPEEVVLGMAMMMEKPLPFWPCSYREVTKERD